VLNALQHRLGKKVYLITNNGLKTRQKLYVVGNAAIARELRQHGIDSYGAGGTEELPPGDKWPDFVAREFGSPGIQMISA